MVTCLIMEEYLNLRKRRIILNGTINIEKFPEIWNYNTKDYEDNEIIEKCKELRLSILSSSNPGMKLIFDKILYYYDWYNDIIGKVEIKDDEFLYYTEINGNSCRYMVLDADNEISDNNPNYDIVSTSLDELKRIAEKEINEEIIKLKERKERILKCNIDM
jgi:hypothetical protein